MEDGGLKFLVILLKVEFLVESRRKSSVELGRASKDVSLH